MKSATTRGHRSPFGSGRAKAAKSDPFAPVSHFINDSLANIERGFSNFAGEIPDISKGLPTDYSKLPPNPVFGGRLKR